MPAIAYQQPQSAFKRNDNSRSDQVPCSAVRSMGAVTRNSTGEPLTNSFGSALTVHAPAGLLCAPASPVAEKNSSAILTKPSFMEIAVVAGFSLRQPHSVQRRKISEPLVPPKPKEFESAMFTAVLRATLGT